MTPPLQMPGRIQRQGNTMLDTVSAPVPVATASDVSNHQDRRAYRGPERRGDVLMQRWLARMLDEAEHGMLLITPHGTLRHANQPGRQELALGCSLRLVRQVVQTPLADQQSALACALADASRGKRRLLTLGHNGHALPVAAVPMASEDDAHAALVLLVLGKRQPCETLSLDFFARGQGLTSAETKVLQALCNGDRPKDIARQFGVAVSTIRTQISSIRAKTQTSGIRELVDRVMALPPIASAMKSWLSR